jgi:hypothetical protein
MLKLVAYSIRAGGKHGSSGPLDGVIFDRVLAVLLEKHRRKRWDCNSLALRQHNEYTMHGRVDTPGLPFVS